MTWREKMGVAKFRGVPFVVESTDRASGRRAVVHEYPFKDEAFSEDLGRKPRRFSVEGYVIGPDYLVARDELLEALELAGPGELVHPAFYGTRRVQVLDYRVRESTDSGGMATFSIEFVETSALPARPTAIVDAKGAARASASAARSAVSAEFLAKYSPGTLLASVSDSLRSATLAVNNALGKISMEEQKLAAFKQRIERLQASVSSLVEAPSELLASMVGLVGGFESGGEEALLGLYAFNPGVRPPATTSNRAQEQTNFDATQRLVQRLVVIRSAELALEQAFDSYDTALARRSELTDLLDEQAELAADDTFPALTQLRADLVKALPGEGSDLPRLVRHTPRTTVPSLVLAYRLYGDLSHEEDLIARNRIRHPGFVPGGRELEVLSRG